MRLTRLIVLCLAALCVCGSARALTIPDFRLPAKTFFAQSPAPKDGKKVFAWYMVCCGGFGGNNVSFAEQVVEYKAEILMAKSMGIDGFGLDLMEPNDVYHTAIAAMFQAARDVGPDFKLFFEFDQSLPPKKPVDYVDLMKQYHAHPNYYQFNGLPLVCAYGADCGFKQPSEAVDWWKTNVIQPLVDRGIKIYFVPTTFGQFAPPNTAWISHEATIAEIAGWGDVAQGQSVWMIQLSPIGGGLDTLENYGTELRKAGKTWMSTISTHYWVGSSRSVPGWYWKPGQAESPTCINGSYFEHAGGQGLAAQWDSVIRVQKPEWVMLLTWNDYNESYIEPVDDYKKYPNGTADAPLGWYKPQCGMDELNRYYVQWYKSGVQPPITADSIFYAYRTSSAALKAELDTRAPVKCGNGSAPDSLFVTTALTAPAELRVLSGGVAASQKVPAGIHSTLIPFHVGPQTFSLWRNGVKINSVTGEPVVSSIKFYDYWPTTGYVETPVAGRK
ncbi:MAG: endo-1,3-alpha-glucanase family glycosylhydrolase [Capsulimonadaceae bacterium]|nr:endo-1,3-alpha-glucanase family glycosylhydrolase [Capsulimonadaceae bacterium]